MDWNSLPPEFDFEPIESRSARWIEQRHRDAENDRLAVGDRKGLSAVFAWLDLNLRMLAGALLFLGIGIAVLTELRVVGAVVAGGALALGLIPMAIGGVARRLGRARSARLTAAEADEKDRWSEDYSEDESQLEQFRR